MKNKKEKTYWNVKESSIDKTLLEKIKINEKICRLTYTITLICNPLFLIFLCCEKYLIKTAYVVCAIVVVIIALCALIIEIASMANLRKLKKQVQEAQEKVSSSGNAYEKENNEESNNR